MGKTIRTRTGRQGQSTLEYMLVLAAVLLALIAAATNLINPAAKRTLEESANVINAAASQIQNKLR